MRAIAKDKGATVNSLFDVVWAPFQLNPSASSEDVDKRTVYDQKFGKERVDKMIPYMANVGRQDGIEFSYGGTTSNTLNSHRLAEYVLKTKGSEAQNVFIENIFHAYFENEKSPNDTEALCAAAKAAGVEPEEAMRLLKSPTTTPSSDSVSGKIREYREKFNVSGVPHFVVGKYSFSGAQDVSTMQSVLTRSLSSM
eukprot:g2957.t1